MDKPFTLLVHGLHLHGVYMRPLAKRLAHAGYHSHAPSYHTLTQPIDMHARLLHDWLLHHHPKDAPINLVGHSLGGLVMRQFLATYGSHWQVHRCVSLATPHVGSTCANYAHRLFSPLVGRAYPNALDGSCVGLPSGVAFGAIAGTQSLGLGKPVLAYHSRRQGLDDNARQNDGTVYLSETYLPNLTDYLILPVSHTGMLTSSVVAREVVHFLEQGRFSQSSPPPILVNLN